MRDNSKGSAVRLRLATSGWSLGTINLNDIGSSVMVLPPLMVHTSDGGTEKHSSSKQSILHVEVKLAEPSENCMIAIIIWKAISKADSNYSIKNESDRMVTVRQVMNLGDANSNMDICIPPRSWLPFGWIDPSLDSKVMLRVGQGFVASGAKIAYLDFKKVDQKLRLPFSSHASESVDDLNELTSRTLKYREVVVSVEAIDTGRVLKIVPFYGEPTSLEIDHHRTESAFALNLNIKSLAVSLILERPKRRESACS